MEPAIFILSATALPLAQTIKANIGGKIYGPSALLGVDEVYDKAKTAIGLAFQNQHPVIGVCAAAIFGQRRSQPAQLGDCIATAGVCLICVQHRRCVSGALLREYIFDGRNYCLSDFWADGGYQEHPHVCRSVSAAYRGLSDCITVCAFTSDWVVY